MFRFGADAMVGRGATKQRHTPAREPSCKEYKHTPTGANTPSTSSTPIAAVPFDSSTPIHSAPGNGNFESAEIDSLVQRYLASAQYKTALFWADKRLALCRKNGSQPSFVDMAEFVKVLAAAGEWTRLMAYCDRHELIMKHMFFAYYYVNALFRKKLYLDILKLKLGAVDRCHDLVFSIMPYMLQLSKPKSFVPTPEEIAALDKMSEDLQIEAGLLLLLGKTYLITQNRRAAFSCLQGAVYKDDSGIEAFELIQKYRLYSKHRFEELIERSGDKSSVVVALRNHYFSQGSKNVKTTEIVNQALVTDLSIRTARAAYLYQIGDLVGAFNVTNEILDEAGMFQDCLLIHVATLVQLHRFEDLFILAHKLVDSQPDNETSWYTVGCYYYTIGHLGAAKNFLNKCTTMNCSFGEGWLAFGHALTAESEHEQAMNCYLRASRVLEGSFEPLMYIGLEYAYANNTKLAQDFLKDSAEIAGDNALVLHEQGCICYMKKEWKNAETFFTKALLLACNETDEKIDPCDLLCRPLSDFWEPLVNNLGHVKRKLGHFEQAIKFHQKSLLMCPKKPSGSAGIAVALACAGDVDQAVWYFHKSLNLYPHNTVLKQGLQKLMDFLESNACLLSNNAKTPTTFSQALTKFVITQGDLEGDIEEKQAQRKALETFRRKQKKRGRQERSARKALELRQAPQNAGNDDVEMS